MMRHAIGWLGVCGLIAGGCVAADGPARADEQPFFTLYTTQTEAADETEVEQAVRWNAGHARESFNALQSFSEVEYGITDDFQASLYLNYGWARTRPSGSAAETDSDLGLSGELIYRLTNAYTDPVGLAIYLEPSVGPNQRGLELKLLGQKNFGDALRTVVNVNFEDTWEKQTAAPWRQTSALEFDFGAIYRLSQAWSVGLEFDNERGFDGLIVGSPAHEVSNSFYLGPTIDFDSDFADITFGVQTQLPIATNPAEIPGATVGGYTAGDEHFRVGLRLARDL
jgi:hypothetical protein